MPATDSPDPQTTGEHVFSSNTLITGGTFVTMEEGSVFQTHTYRTSEGSQSMHKLAEVIAPGAFHNSAERYDPPKCYPKTREAVLKKIMDWVQGLEEPRRRCFFMWLYGPAGAGKSAIAQTIAELCYELNLLAASFFFFRTAAGRNDHSRLIATLTYQLCQSIPEIRSYVEDAIERDPNIFSLSLEKQVHTLIIKPLSHFHDHLSRCHDHRRPLLIIIDGLDECASANYVQRSVLQIFAERLPIPMFFLIASRPEMHIREFFRAEPMSSITTTLTLDDSYEPDVDIKLFLEAKFDAMKQAHPSRARLPESWPSSVDIDHIVRKSSGQFIYAATVMKYVESHRHWPTDRLAIIFDIMSRGNDIPFAALDALYTHIFSSVEDVDKVLEVFSVLLLVKPSGLHKSPVLIEHFLGLRSGDLDITLIDLHSILDIPYVGGIRVLHASLGDFLLDQTRSGKYYINQGHAYNLLARHLMGRIPQKVTSDLGLSPLFFQASSDSAKPFAMLPHSEIAVLDQLSSVMFTVHCMQSYPTAELLNALWNLELFPFWTHFYAHLSNPLVHDLISLSDFFTWLKNNGSIKDGQSLYSHYMLAWDQYIQHSLTQLSLGPFQSQYLVFFILPQIRNNYQARDLFTWDTFGAEYQSLINVFFTLKICHDDGSYNRFLTEFFDDPNRSGRFYLDGDAYANFSIIFMKYIIKCTSRQDWRCDLSCLSIILSKASHLPTLATLLNSRLLSLIEVKRSDLAREAADIVKAYTNTTQSLPAYRQAAEGSDVVTGDGGLNSSREDSITDTSQSSFTTTAVNETIIGQAGSALANLKTPKSKVEFCTARHKQSRDSPNVNGDASPPKRSLRLNQNTSTTKKSPSASTSCAPAHPSTIACEVAVTEPSPATATPIIMAPRDITAVPPQPIVSLPVIPTTTNRGRGRHPPTRLTPNLGRGSPRGRGGRGRWL